MISIEKFHMNSESLVRKFEDSEGFLLVGQDLEATTESLYLFVNTYKYIKEYLKILNDKLKDSLSTLGDITPSGLPFRVVIDETDFLRILKEKQEDIIFNYESFDISRLIALKFCVNIIRSSRVG